MDADAEIRRVGTGKVIVCDSAGWAVRASLPIPRTSLHARRPRIAVPSSRR
jgi:hypothetical protein